MTGEAGFSQILGLKLCPDYRFQQQTTKADTHASLFRIIPAMRYLQVTSACGDEMCGEGGLMESGTE